MNFSESSSSSMSQPYQVFLSFRGEDTRYTFTDHIHQKLVERGYKVFRDNERIANGQPIGSTLQEAIKESKVSVVVFSPDYASSKWCLDELETIINRHKQEAHNVIPVFYHVEPSDVRNQRGRFAEAFLKHDESFKDSMEKVERWRAALRKVGEIKGERIKEERYEAEVIQRIADDVGRIIEKGVEEDLRKRKYTFLVTDMVGGGFERARDNIWSLLMKDEVVRIGVCGMGGIGKTTVMEHIHKQLQETSQQQFRDVYWITASQDCDIRKLQDHIAKIIHLDITNEVDDRHRAARLANELAGKKNFILIIDDLWQFFDLKEVGLPHEGYKLMFTTRSVEVCRQMDCQNNIIKLEPLSPEEGWELFERELGEYNINVKSLAKEIVNECGGLPLAIKTFGRTMKGVNDESEWRNAVVKLKDLKPRESRLDPVFDILRFSYDRLTDRLQQCLLYCALFPEDFEISKKQLIEYMIFEGIIETEECRMEEVDEGQVMLNGLVDRCLLEDGYHGYVKMHDLTRDIAIKILSEEPSGMVKSGKKLTKCPDEDKWKQSLVRVSLMRTDIKEMGSNYWQPICPNLSTLLLSGNRGLKTISDCLFERLDGLKVLDLSYTSIQGLPESVSNLVRLSALLLTFCVKLKYIPSLAKLTALEKLDLRKCEGIKKVPDGMKFLRKLRYLNLIGCKKLKEFPAGILPELSELFVLRIDWELTLKGQEVGCLKKLEDLECGFPNLAEFNKYL